MSLFSGRLGSTVGLMTRGLVRSFAPVRLMLTVGAAIAVIAMPTGVAAHVNRTAGPYRFLVVLVEEPVFQDNHAGFEFWVKKDGTPIAGLEHVLRAQATGHQVLEEMAISPMDASGFYVVDHTKSGAAFDPKGGGVWTLRLTGAIDRTPVDVWFPVTFPGYPRVAAINPPGVDSGPPASQATQAGPPTWLVLAAAAVVVAGVAVGAARRRRMATSVPNP